LCPADVSDPGRFPLGVLRLEEQATLGEGNGRCGSHRTDQAHPPAQKGYLGGSPHPRRASIRRDPLLHKASRETDEGGRHKRLLAPQEEAHYLPQAPTDAHRPGPGRAPVYSSSARPPLGGGYNVPKKLGGVAVVGLRVGRLLKEGSGLVDGQQLENRDSDRRPENTALWRREPDPGLIHHSDHGSQ